MDLDASMPTQSSNRAAYWIAGALVVAWALAISGNWWEWSTNVQYEYGPLVPVLCVLLLGRRWPDRPEPANPSAAGKQIAFALAAVALALLLAVQPFVLSNADWRVGALTSGFAGVTLTLAAIYLSGGRPWLGHFAFPVMFFLIALPWPGRLENPLMSFLMTRNASFCAEILQWLGYPARAQGNLIALPGNLLGVEEACSGVRSLQSGIMVALAVGEFFRLSVARRVALLALALFGAVAGNAARSLILSTAACRGGGEAVDRIHDATGLGVLVVTFGLTLIVGKLLASPRKEDGPPDRPLIVPWAWPYPRLTSLVLIVLFAGAYLGSEAWFHWHEARNPVPARLWAVSAMPKDGSVKALPVHERTLGRLLRPDIARSEQWKGAGATDWHMLFFQWRATRTAAHSVMGGHDPRSCIAGMGMQLKDTLPEWTGTLANGDKIVFDRYEFDDRGESVQVFQAVALDDGTGVNPGSAHFWGRLKNVAEGKRTRGLRVLELAVRGIDDPATAEAAAQSWLSERVRGDGESSAASRQ